MRTERKQPLEAYENPWSTYSGFYTCHNRVDNRQSGTQMARSENEHRQRHTNALASETIPSRWGANVCNP